MSLPFRTRRATKRPLSNTDLERDDVKENIRPTTYPQQQQQVSVSTQVEPSLQKAKLGSSPAKVRTHGKSHGSTEAVVKKEAGEVSGIGDTDSTEDNVHPGGIGLNETNVVYMESDGRSTAEEIVEPMGDGYVELAPVYDSSSCNNVEGSEYIYHHNNNNYTVHVLPATNEGDHQNVLAYAWSPNVQVSDGIGAEPGTNISPVNRLNSSLHTPYAAGQVWPSNCGKRPIFATAVQSAQNPGQTALILTSNPMAGSRLITTEDAAGDAYRRETTSYVPIRKSSTVTNGISGGGGSVNGKGEVQHKERQYTPSPASRQSHNEKERRRRSRMKESCERLRQLVPGVSEKTDKATVLEKTVQYLEHLKECPSNKCKHIVSGVPHISLPNLQYLATATIRYETATATATASVPNDATAQVEEVCELTHYCEHQQVDNEKASDGVTVSEAKEPQGNP